jgi:hypothetical protein
MRGLGCARLLRQRDIENFDCSLRTRKIIERMLQFSYTERIPRNNLPVSVSQCDIHIYFSIAVQHSSDETAVKFMFLFYQRQNQ